MRAGVLTIEGETWMENTESHAHFWERAFLERRMWGFCKKGHAFGRSPS
jgi:hypothetical protein